MFSVVVVGDVTGGKWMPDVRRASYTLYQRSCIEDRSACSSTKRTSKMRSPGRPSSAVLASSWHPVACATQPDVPLPHDLVGDGLALGLLSHTLLLLPCVPRPRVQVACRFAQPPGSPLYSAAPSRCFCLHNRDLPSSAAVRYVAG
jgi:hypothetical protein